MDSDSDVYGVSDAGSEDYQIAPKPKKPTKASTTKSTSATKAKSAAAATAKPKNQPLSKRNLNTVESDVDGDVTMLDNEADVSIVPPIPSKSANGKTASETYQKLTQLEHIIKRPDTYIGSVEKQTETLWVYDSVDQQMKYRETTYVPGFYKIFDEILVNAADNKVRDPKMDHLKVTIDKAQGTISVWNNGSGIPIEMHSKEHVYIPELIFGHLLTSSNYDDNEAKVTGGRNGYGAKLTNIYSTEFTIETADQKNELKYKQVFTNNMHQKGKPKITKNSKKEQYTCITFKPDLKLFGMDCIDSDIEALMMKRVYDMAGTIKDIKVSLNGERIKLKNFKQYVEMYVSAINELSGTKPSIIYESADDKGRTWEVAFAVSDGSFRQVSFVNNIATIKGGKHIDHVADQVVSKLIEAAKKHSKSSQIRPAVVKNQLWVFVNCQVVNPTFDGQTKEYMTLKPSAFGSKWTLSDEFAKKIIKSGVIDNILTYAKAKQELALKKTDGVKRTRLTNIPKLEDANNAGGRKGKECTLILTEGDSAKTLAVAGLSEVGRDNYGVFPLRGKLLNVREANHDQIMKNQEVKFIKEILGLKHGHQYMNVDSLRYGSVMIMTDQDHDGSHIKGLIINFLDHFYPSLLKIPNFLVEFITPIVKCTKGKREVSFFTIPEYEQWKELNNNGRGWTIKYYKGLGTSESKDIKKYFRALGTHMLPFDTLQPGDRDLIDLAFNKKKADDRKEWLRHFRPGTFLDHRIEKVPYADFINKELILFSMADNVRSIPSMVDGLKPGQRKVMFGCFKRKLKGEIKVAQLQGYVSEHTAYHHGEMSLQMTIVGLAQDFVGSNNVNLLMPNGQFGTRLMGGKDAASARYIFTSIPKITRALFHSADDDLLNYLDDDGQSIEPQWYMPVIPQVLINGAEGIGTGWSTSVPNYNPRDIVENLRRRMAGEDYVPMKPWYRGFTGDIEEVSPGRFKVSGKVNQIDEKTYEIVELPIRVWTSSYKEGLEERVSETDKVPATVKDYKEYHTESTVHFIVEVNNKGQQEIASKGVDSFFKTSNQISTNNMVLFDSDGKIKKYASPEEILDDFYMLRMSYYQKRKDYMVDQLKLVYDRLSNQARFVQMIISKQLVVSNRKRADIVTDLRKHDFRPFPKEVKAKVIGDVDDNQNPEDEEEITADSDYDYLLSMAIYNLTKERVEKLLQERDTKEAELTVLLGRTPQNLWDEDLTYFMQEWEAILEEDDLRLKDVGKAGKGKGKVAVKKSAKSGAAARRVLKPKEESDDDNELIDPSDDSEDDFKPIVAKKKATSTTTTKAPPPPPSPPKKRVVSTSDLDDDDLAALMTAAKPPPKKSKSSSTSSTLPSAAAASKKKAVHDDSVIKDEISVDISDFEDDDHKKLAPLFRKTSKPTTTATSKSSSSSSAAASGSTLADKKKTTATKKTTASSAAATTASKKKTAPVKTFILSDSDDDLIIALNPPAKSIRKVSGSATATKRSISGSKKKAVQESEEEEEEGDNFMDDSIQQNSTNAADDSILSQPRRSGRSKITTTRKASYKLDSEEDDDDDDY